MLVGRQSTTTHPIVYLHRQVRNFIFSNCMHCYKEGGLRIFQKLLTLDGMRITVDEGRGIADLKKSGEPSSEWRQDRPNTLTNAFGVVDSSGQGIKGVHVEFTVTVSPRLGLTKYVFSLMRQLPGCHARLYQLEVSLRDNLKPTDHGYSHEHYGTERVGRYVADSDWAQASFKKAVEVFCDKCNLTLLDELPDYREFKLN